MKKIFFILTVMLFACSACFADEEAEVKQFFYDYMNAANNYKSDYFKYYSDNAKIVRIVEKPDGTQKSVNVPLDRYKKEAKKSALFAKLRRYKNIYSDIIISKHGEDYKLSALRAPSTSDYKIPAEFIIGKDNNGEWKIKEEYMNTKIQRFLKE